MNLKKIISLLLIAVSTIYIVSCSRAEKIDIIESNKTIETTKENIVENTKETIDENLLSNLNIEETDNMSLEGMKINNINKAILMMLDKQTKENIIFSNTGIQSVLKMASFAADGNTKVEIDKINGDFNKDLNSNAVNIYNFVTVNENNKNAKVKDSFIDILKNTKWIKSDVYEINKSNSAEKISKEVNDRILQETNGQIKDGVDKKSYEKEDFIMQLGNVIHFNGTWDNITKDKPYKTKNLYFTNENNEKVVTDFIIVKKDDARLIENDDIIGIALDYKEEENRYKFIAFLPKNKDNYDLSKIDVSDLPYYRGNYELITKFPKFEFNNKINLIPIMKALGINDIFDENKANLKNGFDFKEGDNIYASAFEQKCAIRVDEVGTEASALTTMDFAVLTALPSRENRIVDITFNRPFYFFIYDNIENIPLFVGKIKNMEDNGKEVIDTDKNIETIVDTKE